MRLFKQNTFYCFSPFIMGLTMVIELTILLRSFLTRKWSFTLMLGLLIIFCLALFQGVEYAICETSVSEYRAGQLGLVAITALPVLGVHFVQSVRGRKANIIIHFAYATMITWWVSLLLGAPMKSQGCTGNYVILEFNNWHGEAYFVYYYFWLAVGSLLAIIESSLPKTPRKTRVALISYVAGYASFTVPATVIWLTVDSVSKGLPSIMCGFAVIFALILGVLVLPLVTDKKRT